MDRHLPKPATVHRRRGAVLALVLVCLMVAMALLVSIAKLAAGGRRMVQAEAQQVQAAWLAESGLQRAAAQLAADPDYQGETWSLPAELLPGTRPAAVKIEVQPVPAQPDQRLVRVQADYPDDPQHRARHTKQALVQVSRRIGEEP
jgi:Tfp pilus assembly protein PilX